MEKITKLLLTPSDLKNILVKQGICHENVENFSVQNDDDSELTKNIDIEKLSIKWTEGHCKLNDNLLTR